jgi:hypothetical protein
MGLRRGRLPDAPFSPEQLSRQLWWFFRDHGYLCRPWRSYWLADAEGWEVRFLVTGAEERLLLRLLAQAGWHKVETRRAAHRRLVCVPGRDAVESFRGLWDQFRDEQPGPG